MSSKVIAFLAQALLVQVAFTQYIGNSVVDNNVVINSGANGIGWADLLGADGYGLASAYGSAGSGVGLANGVGVVNVPAAGVEVIGGNLGGYGWDGIGLGLGSGLNLDAGLGWDTDLGFGASYANGLAGVDLFNAGLGANLGGLAWNNELGLGAGLGNVGLSSSPFLDLGSLSSGGGFPVTSVSSVVPTGITVVSDNVIEGVVFVIGQLPFLSAVSFEGAVATGGYGGTSCGCGNGNVGILSESTIGGLEVLGGVVGLGDLGYFY